MQDAVNTRRRSLVKQRKRGEASPERERSMRLCVASHQITDVHSGFSVFVLN